MNRLIQTIAVAAVLCVVNGVALAGQEPVNPGMIMGDVSLGAIGPEADPYLEHYHGTYSPQYSHLYWSNLVVNGARLGDIRLSAAGPEADPYLEHYSGTALASNGNLPIAMLQATTWKLSDFHIVAQDGTVSHPLGNDAMGYLIVSRQGLASVTIKANGGKTGESFYSYVGRLNVENDNSIHPILSYDSSWVGVDQVKSWQIQDGKLVLTTPTNGFGGDFGQLVWEPVR